jgi:hypothetical protein
MQADTLYVEFVGGTKAGVPHAIVTGDTTDVCAVTKNP